MIKVYVKKQSNYPVSSLRIKKSLQEFLTKEGIVSNAQVSVALVGEAKMLDIGKKFLKDNALHNVLSFTQEELGNKSSFVYPPDSVIYLGEIVICFPEVVRQAKEESKLIEEKVLELALHGAEHLLGRHHE